MMTRKCLKIFGGIIILATLVRASLGADCGGKAFRCPDTKHFIICVDLGNGVSSSIDDFVIPCPAGTECRDTNNFECELPLNNTKANLMSTEVTTDNFSIEPTPAYETFLTTTESYGGNVREREIYTEPSTVDTTLDPTTGETTPSDIIEVSSPADDEYAYRPNSESDGSEVPSETTASATTAEFATTVAGSLEITPAESTDTTTDELPAVTTAEITPAESTDSTTNELSAVTTAEITPAESTDTTTDEPPAVTTADITPARPTVTTTGKPPTVTTAGSIASTTSSQDTINSAFDIITTPDSKGIEKKNGMSAQLIDNGHAGMEDVAQSTTDNNTVEVSTDNVFSSKRDGRTTTVQPDAQTAIDSHFYETTTPQIYFISGDAISTVDTTTSTNTDMPIPTVIENPLVNLILNSVNGNPNQKVISTTGHNKPGNVDPSVKTKDQTNKSFHTNEMVTAPIPITSPMSVIPLTDSKTTRSYISPSQGNGMPSSHTETTKTASLNHVADQTHSGTSPTGISATTDNIYNGQTNADRVETFMKSTQTTKSGKLLDETTTEKLTPILENVRNVESHNNKIKSNSYAVKGPASTFANQPIIENGQTSTAKPANNIIIIISSGTTDIKETISAFTEKPATRDRYFNRNTYTRKNDNFKSINTPNQVNSNNRVLNQSQNKSATIYTQSVKKPIQHQMVTAVKQQNADNKVPSGDNGGHSYKTRLENFENKTSKSVIVKEIKAHNTPNSNNKPVVKYNNTYTTEEIPKNIRIPVDSQTQKSNTQTNSKTNTKVDNYKPTAVTYVNSSKESGHSEKRNIDSMQSSNSSVFTEKNVYPPINCTKLKRGRYSDPSDCRKFHICVGNRGIQGICPKKTVFSDVKKQCTKNLSECVRDEKFQCVKAGRFRREHSDDVYYICAKNNLGGFVRYKLLCQKGYRLDKKTIKCISTETKKSSESSEGKFKCKEEGEFPAPGECNKYYECYTKSKKLKMRTILCDSDEIFHKKKKKCVDAESYECDISKIT